MTRRLGLGTRRHQPAEESITPEERRLLENAGFDIDDLSSEEWKNILQALRESEHHVTVSKNEKQPDSTDQPRAAERVEDEAEESDGSNMSTQAPEHMEVEEDTSGDDSRPNCPCRPGDGSEREDASVKASSAQKQEEEIVSCDHSEEETQAYDLNQTHPTSRLAGHVSKGGNHSFQNEPGSKEDEDMEIQVSKPKDKTEGPTVEKGSCSYSNCENDDVGEGRKLPRKARYSSFPYPPLYTPNLLAKPDLYIPVIKLVFNIYLRRVVRGQRDIKDRKEKWGQPVQEGFHHKGCLRMKPPPKSFVAEVEPRGLEAGRRLRSRTCLTVSSRDNAARSSPDSDENCFLRSDGQGLEKLSEKRKVDTGRLSRSTQKQYPSLLSDEREGELRMDVNTDDEFEKEEKRVMKPSALRGPRWMSLTGRRRMENQVHLQVVDSDSDELIDEEDDWVPDNERKKTSKGKGKATGSGTGGKGTKVNTLGTGARAGLPRKGRGRGKKIEESPGPNIESVFKRVAKKKKVEEAEAMHAKEKMSSQTDQDSTMSRRPLHTLVSCLKKPKISVEGESRTGTSKLPPLVRSDSNDESLFQDLMGYKAGEKQTSVIESEPAKQENGNLEEEDDGEDEVNIEFPSPLGSDPDSASNDWKPAQFKNNKIENKQDIDKIDDLDKTDRPREGDIDKVWTRQAGPMLSQDNNSTDSVISLLNMEGEMYCTQVGQRRKKKMEIKANNVRKDHSQNDQFDEAPKMEDLSSRRGLREKSMSRNTVDSVESEKLSPEVEEMSEHWEEGGERKSTRALVKEKGQSGVNSRHREGTVASGGSSGWITVCSKRVSPKEEYQGKLGHNQAKRRKCDGEDDSALRVKKGKNDRPTKDENYRGRKKENDGPFKDDIGTKRGKNGRVVEEDEHRMKGGRNVGEMDDEDRRGDNDRPSGDLRIRRGDKGKPARSSSKTYGISSASDQTSRKAESSTAIVVNLAKDEESPKSPRSPVVRGPVNAGQETSPRPSTSGRQNDAITVPETQLGEEDQEGSKGYCPLCGQQFELSELERHAATCGEELPAPEPAPENEMCMFCERVIPAAKLKVHQRHCALLVADGTSVRQTRSTRGQAQ